MSPKDKPLTWLGGEIKTPPLGREARLFAGFLLRQLQKGLFLEMPYSRPMPTIGKRCHELRIADVNSIWRIVCRVDDDAIVILDVFIKKTSKTPKRIIDLCVKRLASYDKLKNE